MVVLPSVPGSGMFALGQVEPIANALAETLSPIDCCAGFRAHAYWTALLAGFVA